MMKQGMIECSVCHSKLVNPSAKSVSRAYDRHLNKFSKKQRALNVLLVVGDCMLVGLQPILVYMSKVDGKFKFSPISVNFLTEVAKARNQKIGEKRLLSISSFVQAARNNVLLAVPALLYAINNYLKFTMQLYFNPATVKMLSNLKVLVIAVLLKIIMKRRFSIIQWEALALLLIGISINQMRSLPEGSTAMGLPVAMGAYIYTVIFVTVLSLASVFNEYALKSQYDTSIYMQNLFLYGYGAIFNFLGILGNVIAKVTRFIRVWGGRIDTNLTPIPIGIERLLRKSPRPIKGPESFDILQGHSKATMLLIINNAAQGILSSFFFKYADTILKKYSYSSHNLHRLCICSFVWSHFDYKFYVWNFYCFHLNASVFSPLAKVKEEENGVLELEPVQSNHRDQFVNIAAGANEEASHRVESDERRPLLPT